MSFRSLHRLGDPFRFAHHEDDKGDDGKGFVVPSRLEAPLGYPSLALRPLTERDDAEWSDVRMHNRDWLSPWDSNDPLHGPGIGFGEWIRLQRASEREGEGVVLAMEYDGRIVGQVSLGAIADGAVRAGIVGYWVDQRVAGHGFAPLSVAMVCDWAFFDPEGPRLHRIEVDILPENARSLRVVQKLGFYDEGVRRGYMFVNERWRDHRCFSILATDVAHRVIDRLPRC